jgi:tricorn protease-like protein
MRAALVGFLIAAGCGSGTAVSQTSSGVAAPTYAPPAGQERASRVASADAIPASEDERERLLYLRAGSVWAMEADGADGSNLRRLTAPRQGAWFLHDRKPAWSPDGKTVAFASNRHVSSGDHAADFDIYTVGSDGSDVLQLTEDPGVADDPTYSPDGKRIFFASTRDAKNAYEIEIYVMPAVGGDKRRMTRDEQPQNSAPSAGRTQ